MLAASLSGAHHIASYGGTIQGAGMNVFEAIGMFYVILATGVFTAVMLIAAVWSITLGVKVATHRYRLGEEIERTLKEPEAQRRER